MLCAGLWLGYRTLAYTLRPDDEGVRTRLEGFYAEAPGSLDAVFIGSSAVYAYISPPRLYLDTGIRSYLYATPNQSVEMIRYAIRECRRTQPDALYVIELRAMLSSAQDREAIAADMRRMTDNMPYTLNRMQMIHDLAPEKDRFSWYFDLVKYHERWKEAHMEDVRWTWGQRNEWKGWSFSQCTQQIELRDYGRINARILPDEENEEDFRQLLAYCKEQNVSAVFLATPFPVSRRQVKIYNAVGDMAAESGYPFWNLCREFSRIGLDGDTDFADEHHVNTQGALKTTRYLEERFPELLPDGKPGNIQEQYGPFLLSEEDYLEAERKSLEELQKNGS